MKTLPEIVRDNRLTASQTAAVRVFAIQMMLAGFTVGCAVTAFLAILIVVI